ncbi:hypothetical protein CVT24_012059 [Panaeolus cyanescens]|uniref:Uncharacterized protein n=1 Tax=Panaeolus cyanescens TaxID=181874 RepID=A0A409VHS0_9AGAR|nr:hypothetical protein CVT24_012059 [Panaeolus cyanescens]
MTIKFKLGLHLKSASSPAPSSSKAMDKERLCLGRSNSIPYPGGSSPFSRWLLLRKRRAHRSGTRDSIGHSPITPSALSQVTTDRRASDTLPYVSRSVVIHPEDLTDPFVAVPFTEPPRKNNFLESRAHLLEDVPPNRALSSTAEQDLASTNRRLESLDAIFAREPPSPTEFMRLRRGLSMNLYGNRRAPGAGDTGGRDGQNDLGNVDSNSERGRNSIPSEEIQARESVTVGSTPLTIPTHTLQKIQKNRRGPDVEARKPARAILSKKTSSSRSNRSDVLRIAQACQHLARRARKDNPTTCTEAHLHKVMYKIASSIYLIFCAFCAALYWREFVANCIMRPFDRLVPLLCIVLGVGLWLIGLLIRGFVRICFGLFTSFCDADLRRAFHRGEAVDVEGRRLDQAGMIVGGLLS